MSDAEYREFVQSVIDNVKKHGFPEKKVAFPLEQLYEAAEKKGINFNKVLVTLDEIQIAHEKTPEKIIFYPKDRQAPPVETSPTPGPSFPGIDPSMFANLDPSVLQNMDSANLMGVAANILQNMSPEQLESMKRSLEDLSDEEREAMMDQAKKLGLI
jgi:hypothetical protein